MSALELPSGAKGPEPSPPQEEEDLSNLWDVTCPLKSGITMSPQRNQITGAVELVPGAALAHCRTDCGYYLASNVQGKDGECATKVIGRTARQLASPLRALAEAAKAYLSARVPPKDRGDV